MTFYFMLSTKGREYIYPPHHCITSKPHETLSADKRTHNNPRDRELLLLSKEKRVTNCQKIHPDLHS